MDDKQNKVMLTVAVVAERLGVTTRTVQRWVEAGKFPGSERLSDIPKSHYRIPETAVIEFEEKRKL